MRIISHTLHPATDENKIFKSPQPNLEWQKNVPSVPEFYAGKELFVTGFTGFMGKVLIEKLLRSCPDIKAIYVLLRPKKGNSIGERLKTVTDLPLFEPLKKHSPEVFKKLIPINGDVTELQLGMAQDDIERMKNVSIIFHSAASVRFDDTLKYAVLMNTRGTREIMRFAEQLINIKVVMHVSTTYSHPELKVVGEVIHEPYVDWQKTIEICEKMDEDLIDVVTEKYTRFMPNTYTFTKALAEQIIDDHKHKLPLVLFRPSIVISSMKEPFPGWLDNFNGPVGMLIGSSIGITRTLYCNPENIADFTPVDVCIKAMIIGAWKRAHEPSGTLPIYNCCTSNQRTATMEQIIDMGKAIQNETPMDKMLWAPGGGVTRCPVINYIKVIFLQLIPAMLIDRLLVAAGHKPFIAKLQRKIYQANLALQYFILNNWHFENENFIDLCNYLKLEDLKTFNFHDFLEFDLILYFRYAVWGGRRYLMKEKDEDLPWARRRYQRMKLLDTVVKTLLFGSLIYYIFIKQNFLSISTSLCRFVASKHGC